MTAYAAALLAWSLTIGIPNDTVGVTLWLWLGVTAWDPQRAGDFARDWWRPILVLVGYWFLRGLADDANRLIGRPVVVQAPIDFDRWVASWFGGHGTPTEILQRHWCALPAGAPTCTKDLPPHWWDTFFTTVYASHFVTGLTIAAVLWVRRRSEWLMWMRRYLAINFGALVCYILYPMAPPWMASEQGYVSDVIPRLTSRGWRDLGLDRFNLILQGVGNPVAAMPSLHAGITFLVAMYGIWRLRTPLRFLLVLYPLAMCVTLVYYAEHYVVDVLAGGVLAALVMVACGLWERRRARPTQSTIAST